jgi:hypothetical protein
MQPTPALHTTVADAGAQALPLARIVGRAFKQALHDAAAPEDHPSPPLQVAAAAQALGLRTLAARHPGGTAAQRQALALYTRCLMHYRQGVQARLVPASGPGRRDDDLGHAAAYFVLVNLAVLEGREPDALALPAVERQLRRLLASAAEWARCGLAERQQCFEQLAALAVLVNESRLAAQAQGPAAQAHVRTAAQNYLTQMLGLDAERLTVSTAGLAWADESVQ